MIIEDARSANFDATRQVGIEADPTSIPISLDPRDQRMRGTTRDFGKGSFQFDVPYITEISHNLWQGGCAAGLVLPDFIEHVVSLYPWEQYVMRKQPKSANFNWMYDDEKQAVPALVEGIATWAQACVKDGPTLIHCQAGLNRSSLIAARVLMRSDGLLAEQAIALLREKRSPAVLCNPAFENWLLGLGYD